jgi:hypothetical protein
MPSLSRFVVLIELRLSRRLAAALSIVFATTCSAVAAGDADGHHTLARDPAGRALPAPPSLLGGAPTPSSRIVFAGGGTLLGQGVVLSKGVVLSEGTRRPRRRAVKRR